MQEAVGAGGLKNVEFALFRIDDPNSVGTGREILFHFAHELAHAV